MDKESIILLQKIDCNCNDCKFMVRDLERHKKSVELHRVWQLNHFNLTKEKMIAKAEDWKKKGEPEKSEYILEEVAGMKFQFNKNEASINYGHCSKLNKPVSFIPNVCQLETQGCFIHRREEVAIQ